MIKSKTCIACLKDKPVSQFCKDTGYKDGYRGDCNECRNKARHRVTTPEFEAYINPEILAQPAKMPDVRRQVPRRLPALGVQPSFDYKYRPITPPEWLRNREEIPDLPDPKHLPAAYLKRCADYWNDLLGNDGNTTTRIA